MIMDAWKKLWDIATSVECGKEVGVAMIELHDDVRRATLVWPDGSRSCLRWRDGDWQYDDEVSSCPCDVSARDDL